MKFMNMKRFASTVMAGVLSLSLAVPAFAADPSTVIEAAYAPTTVNVTVPTTGNAIINPYGLPIKLGEATISGEKITTGAALLIQNKSSTALSVSATVSAVKKGTFTFDTSPVADSENANKGYVVFQMFSAPGVTEASTEILNPKFAALKNEDALPATPLVLAEHANNTPDPSATDILVLREANADGEPQDGGSAFFRLSGSVAKKPTTPWTTNDGFTATVVFSFEPSTYTKSAGTLTPAATTISLAGVTQQALTFTSALPNGVTAAETTYTSSDPAVLTVTANGASVTGVAAGTATVTVTIKGSDGIIYTATTGTITVTA